MLPDVDVSAVTRDDETHNRGPNILFPTNLDQLQYLTLSFFSFLSLRTIESDNIHR